MSTHFNPDSLREALAQFKIPIGETRHHPYLAVDDSDKNNLKLRVFDSKLAIFFTRHCHRASPAEIASALALNRDDSKVKDIAGWVKTKSETKWSRVSNFVQRFFISDKQKKEHADAMTALEQLAKEVPPVPEFETGEEEEKEQRQETHPQEIVVTTVSVPIQPLREAFAEPEDQPTVTEQPTISIPNEPQASIPIAQEPVRKEVVAIQAAPEQPTITKLMTLRDKPIETSSLYRVAFSDMGREDQTLVVIRQKTDTNIPRENVYWNTFFGELNILRDALIASSKQSKEQYEADKVRIGDYMKVESYEFQGVRRGQVIPPPPPKKATSYFPTLPLEDLLQQTDKLGRTPLQVARWLFEQTKNLDHYIKLKCAAEMLEAAENDDMTKVQQISAEAEKYRKTRLIDMDKLVQTMMETDSLDRIRDLFEDTYAIEFLEDLINEIRLAKGKGEVTNAALMEPMMKIWPATNANDFLPLIVELRRLAVEPA